MSLGGQGRIYAPRQISPKLMTIFLENKNLHIGTGQGGYKNL
jgi:hypothetical protein